MEATAIGTLGRWRRQAPGTSRLLRRYPQRQSCLSGAVTWRPWGHAQHRWPSSHGLGRLSHHGQACPTSRALPASTFDSVPLRLTVPLVFCSAHGLLPLLPAAGAGGWSFLLLSICLGTCAFPLCPWVAPAVSGGECPWWQRARSVLAAFPQRSRCVSAAC